MGIMKTISVIIIAIIFITIIGFGAQGRSELYHILKVQTLSNRTPDAQPAIGMEGGAADRNHSGEGQGGTHITGNHRGEGGIPWGGGGGGPSSAAPYMWSPAPRPPPPPPPPPLVYGPGCPLGSLFPLWGGCGGFGVLGFWVSLKLLSLEFWVLG